MTTNSNRSDEVRKDLDNLRIEAENENNLTVELVKAAYRKTAMIVHPDKADPKNQVQVQEYTAAFQELGNAYERVLKYMIDNMQKRDEEAIAHSLEILP